MWKKIKLDLLASQWYYAYGILQSAIFAGSTGTNPQRDWTSQGPGYFTQLLIWLFTALWFTLSLLWILILVFRAHSWKTITILITNSPDRVCLQILRKEIQSIMLFGNLRQILGRTNFPYTSLMISLRMVPSTCWLMCILVECVTDSTN